MQLSSPYCLDSILCQYVILPWKNSIKNTWLKFTCIYVFLQGFIETFLLTSVFLKGLSFMAVGHSPKCVSTLTLAAGGLSPQLFILLSHVSFGALIFSFLGLFFFFVRTFYTIDDSQRQNRINKALSK